MEKTSFHGNSFGITIFFVLVLALSSVAGTYRLKKSAEIKYWEKSLNYYSTVLEQENETAIKEKTSKDNTMQVAYLRKEQ